MAIFLLATLASGCIKDEPLESEADILSVYLEGVSMVREAQISNDSITIIVDEGTDVSAVAAYFTLTKGATIEPASGSVTDFRKVQHYTVTSEDRCWEKRYAVRVSDGGLDTTGGAVCLSFERCRTATNGAFEIFYELNKVGEVAFEWSSGNEGYGWTAGDAATTDFPTYQWQDGYKGRCVCLTTRKTGSLGVASGKPMAAGNIYIGNFDFSQVITAPLHATRFGIPFRYEPVRMEGWMQYSPGATYYEPYKGGSDGLKANSAKNDTCAIYAVLYEPTTERPYLYGDNVLAEDNDQIICTAQLGGSDCSGNMEWRHFEIPFTMRKGKSIDNEKLRKGKYNLTVVCSSSKGGATFEGAIGSRLLVDEIKIEVK